MEELKKIKVKNFEDVKNQFLIETSDTIILQSYNSIVAIWNYTTQTLTLGRDYDYSNTTSKYLKRFINKYTKFNYENKRELLKLIEENANIIYNEIY